MIHIQRKEKAPKCLEKRKDYKCNDVIEKLEKDFYGKCYICETNQFSINVEHFIPHKGDENLKYKWENLFLACNHCNNIKLTTEILDCTNPEHDLESIEFEPIFFPESKIEIKTSKKDKLTINTVEILNKVYNGHTEIKTKDAEKLKEYLIEEILVFQKLMLLYKKEKFNAPKKLEIEKKIGFELSKAAKLTAFKRQVIKNNPKYQEFIKYFD